MWGRTVIGCGLMFLTACSAMPVEEPVLDLSDFERFTFARQGALGFCPPAYAAYSAEISMSEDQRYRLSVSWLERGVEGDEACLQGVTSPDGICLVQVGPVEFNLADDDLAAFRDLSRVRYEESDSGPCAADPCVINQFTWDSTEFTDDPCASTRITCQHTQAIVNWLDGFRALWRRAYSPDDDNGPVVQDFTSFHHFAFGRGGEYPPCVPPHRLYDAEINRGCDGRLELRASLVEVGLRGRDECLEQAAPDCDCLTVAPLRDRVLTDAEAAAFLQLFSRVQWYNAIAPEDLEECLLFDPYLVDWFKWDAFRATSVECFTPHISRDVADAIREALLLSAERNGG